MEDSGLRTRKVGIGYAIAAYSLWGVLPLYWHAMQQISALEILAHRILWSFVFVGVILYGKKRWEQVRLAMMDRESRNSILLASVLITLNWFIYIWAVNTEHVIEASLGYYINPLFSILLGMFILKERLNFWQLLSLVLAGIGVLIVTFQYGQIPWIAFMLTITFGLYGLVKKMIKVESIVGLGLETLIVTPLSLIYILFIQFDGTGAVGRASLTSVLLLIGSGIVTAFPLFWFAQGAKMVPLSTIGFIQYLSPSISLLLGIFFFKETFSLGNMICFSFIWFALFIYSLSHTSFLKGLQPNYFKKNETVTITKEA